MPLIPLTGPVSEDPLDYLIVSPDVRQYQKGEVIYSYQDACTTIHVVMDGMVKISHMSDTGMNVVSNIYGQDELFGESAFLGQLQRGEQAVAIKETEVMVWTAGEK